MSAPLRPISPERLVTLLSERIVQTAGIARVAVDGPPPADPHALADALVAALQAAGRPVHVVRAETFWHDASLRFEHGREDPDAYLGWLDGPTLRREVLDSAVTRGTYLPSLRNPATNRSTRAEAVPVAPDAVLIVSGALLLGLGLPFEFAVHLSLSPAALARRTPPELAWTLPAFGRYDAEVRPEQLADVVVRADDPDHPAVRAG